MFLAHVQWLSLNTQVLIENGILLSGILSKDTLGNKAGSLMHVITMEWGHEVARCFYGNVQLLVNNYLLIEGHSIGIGDTIADSVTYNDIQRAIRQAKVHEHVQHVLYIHVYALYMYVHVYNIIYIVSFYLYFLVVASVLYTFVVQLQRNSHADKTCIMSSGQSDTYIRQETLIATRSIVASCQG